MSRKKFYLMVLILVSLFFSSCAIIGTPVLDSIETVDQVDLERYTGVWYEIASLPTTFAKNLVCVTATYTIMEDGKVEVLNQGYKGSTDGKLSSITGTAWVPNPEEPGQLKVRFFPIIPPSQYNIIVLDEEEYSYAMVTGKNYNYLWILSRTPQMESETYDMLIQKAEDWGFDVAQIKVTPQTCW
ncbi:MAG: lipocalin family protein [Atribacterota bacterium]|jgi:lipocalin|nr:lipocalin family protein [Atribacterota bacterium]MDD3641040.1 lipocalin family protein [Atribacterota bacterium]MDD4289195.1 lipocalin family protein [Atribacterota bacterium]MDD4765538.1 lipocalin family protein [Atribacterota bacterium]MDD5635720.1 lipocalin family protein [Atribacterota bacterium]